MTRVPPDFGGFIGYWLEGHAYLARYGHGRPIEGVQMTPLNLLQARKLLDGLIENGLAEGRLTDKDIRQSEQLPMTPMDKVLPRERVDEIAGDQ